MPGPLLETKITLPPRRGVEITRSALLHQLTRGLEQQRKLSLISAPAGYGKTTLISSWLNELTPGRASAWYSLEESDNDLARFLSYLTAAVRKALPDLANDTAQILAESNNPNLSLLLDEFLNDLHALGQPLMIVLDDYHLIHDSTIHNAVEHSLEHLPAHVHLVIATRQDPPLPLSRLRARNQLTELRARDLRFSTDESVIFFEQVMNLVLSPDSAQILDQRTEGWAVGLQLAGLAMQRQSDPEGFIQTFRGSHRYILDYLGDEVLVRLSTAEREFLTRTCLLDRFCAETCVALTGNPEAGAILDRLERANLFLVPLDSERRWYRYHHLFSEYLHSLLHREEQARLYRAAADWFASCGLYPEAVKYALASKDLDTSAQIIDEALRQNETWSGGDLQEMLSWLGCLAPEAYRDRPRLCINASRLMYIAGRVKDAEQFIALSEAALAQWPQSQEKNELLALGRLYRGSLAALQGDTAAAVKQTLSALPAVPESNRIAIARGHYSLGLAYQLEGEIQPAIDHYLESSRQAQLAGVLFLAIHARCGAAEVMISTGKLTAAEETCKTAMDLASGKPIPPLGLVKILMGWIALEHNLLPQARALLEEGIALSRRGVLEDVVLTGYSHLVRLLLALGDRETADKLIQAIFTSTQNFDFQRIQQIGAAHLARYSLATGGLAAASQWADQILDSREGIGSELIDFTLARILIAQRNLAPVSRLVQPHLDQAERTGRLKTEIEACLLLARCAQAERDLPAARSWLGRSLRPAAAEKWIRLYLDEGQDLIELLPAVRNEAPQLVDEILQAAAPVESAALTPAQLLPDPLSEQELRVLRLITAGKSNREIASELFISVGTAKWHVHNILQKLGVSNRPQAIARAREMNLS